MKKLLSPLIVLSIVLVASANISIAQEVKVRDKVEMSDFATKKFKAVQKKSQQKDNFQKNEKLITRPVRKKAQIIAHPVKRSVEK